MTEKWARGDLSRNALRGWAVEHWHWVSHMPTPNFYICAHAPKDVINLQASNYHDETDEERPHLDIVLRFAAANGEGVFVIDLPAADAPRIYGLSMMLEERLVQAQGYLLILPEPRLVLLRAGALQLGSES